MTAANLRPPVNQTELVKAALQEIRTNYREASLSRIAKNYGVSLAYVSECVRIKTGKTYKSLLHKRRLTVAARLLRSTDLRISDIIRQVGYENSSYFYHLFFNRYGKTPLTYRLERPQV